jgi:hypothetical protein
MYEFKSASLYLTKYIDEIKNDINESFNQLLLNNSNNLSQTKQVINQNWTKMINKVNDYQSECNEHLNSLNKQFNNLITVTEIFMNKTLILLDKNKFSHYLLLNQCDTTIGKLLLITNQYLKPETIIQQLINKKIKFEQIITNESIKLINMIIKDLNSEQIQDLKLIFSKIDSIQINDTTAFILEKYSFKDFIYLKQINLSRNLLKEINSNTFRELHLLKYLNLSGNCLNRIEINSFSSLISLNTLDLSHNCLKHLDSTTFRNLSNLRILNLAWNELNTIDSNTFQQMNNLRELYVNNNRLDSDAIHGGKIFNGLTNLHTIWLHDNLIIKNSDEIDFYLYMFKELNLKRLRLTNENEIIFKSELKISNKKKNKKSKFCTII